jgi:hypothetical protein
MRTVFVASNVSSITCSWSRRPLAIGDALAGSHDGQRRWSRGNAQGDRLACARKILEPTLIRLLRRIGGLRSIECEFDHLFLVETSLGNRRRACRIPLRPAPFVAWACERRSIGLRAENIRADSRQAATGKLWVCVASNVSSITCSWSRRPVAIGDALAGSLYGQRCWSRGNAQGDRLACAQKILEPTHVRLLRGNWGSA